MDKNSSDGYGAVSLEERTNYYEYPYPEAATFYEGENLKIIDVAGILKAETQIMTNYGLWSNNEQFIFKSGAAGDYVRFYINIDQSGNYNMNAVFTKARDFGIVQYSMAPLSAIPCRIWAHTYRIAQITRRAGAHLSKHADMWQYREYLAMCLISQSSPPRKSRQSRLSATNTAGITTLSIRVSFTVLYPHGKTAQDALGVLSPRIKARRL